MKIYLTLFALVAATLLFSVHSANAVTYDLKDHASCQAISGTWDNPTSACTVSSLWIDSGDLLTVDNSFLSTILLKVTDSLNNRGTIDISGSITIANSGILNNNGSITNYCTGQCVGGTIQNEGTITNNNGGTIITNGTINNLGSINNFGTIKNTGTITNGGKLINNFKGMITNSGTIHNDEQSAIINSGGNITNYATVIGDVAGTITNSGTIKNMCGGTFTSDGDFLGTPVENVSCNTSKSSAVGEFPFATPALVIGFLSILLFYKAKTSVLSHS
ncbi:MAG: hypothetical protein KGI27_11350 [Thaumarchaeota archaeon]|nr:hypothetical protein [Nitrososphaerota archaeon]